MRWLVGLRSRRYHTVFASRGATTLLLPTNPNASLFFFDLKLLQSSPTQSTGGFTWSYGTALSRFGGSHFTQTSAGPNPPGYNYPIIVYTMRPSAFQLSTNGTTQLIADVGAAPEPATLLLLGTGLAGLFARRRKPHVGKLRTVIAAQAEGKSNGT